MRPWMAVWRKDARGDFTFVFAAIARVAHALGGLTLDPGAGAGAGCVVLLELCCDACGCGACLCCPCPCCMPRP